MSHRITFTINDGFYEAARPGRQGGSGMGLGEVLNGSYHAARAPWSDVPRGAMYPSEVARLRRKPQDDRYDAAAAELRKALADGAWHPLAELHAIAKRHKVRPTILADRAAVYYDTKRCVWTKALLEKEESC